MALMAQAPIAGIAIGHHLRMLIVARIRVKNEARGGNELGIRD